MTLHEELENHSYEVEFMNLVVDKANNFKIVDCDSHFSDFSGVHHSKIKQGKLFLQDLIKPIDRERIFQAICKKNARFVYMDFDILNKKKKPVFVHCTGQNLEDNTLCRLTLADVSKSRKKQAELQERATQMDNLIDLVNGGVCLFKVSQDMQIEVIFLNEECCRLFGTTKENYSGQVYKLNELIHPDDRSVVFQGIGKTMALGEPMDTECRVMVHKDEFIWCKMDAGIQRYDENKCPVFHAVFTDITRIKEAEKKADEESDRLIRLFKNLPEAIFITEEKTPLKLEIASSDFIKFIGYSRSEIFDIFAGNLVKIMDKEDAVRVEEDILNQLKTEKQICVNYKLMVSGGREIFVCDRRKVILQDDGAKTMVGVLSAVPKI